MRKEIGELVPIKLIKRITRNYGKVGKIMVNTKKTKKKYCLRIILNHQQLEVFRCQQWDIISQIDFVQ